MSQDGRPQVIPRSIEPSGEDTTIPCPCGGSFPSWAKRGFHRCSNGEYRCMHCMREARRSFAKRGFTCGPGCRRV